MAATPSAWNCMYCGSGKSSPMASLILFIIGICFLLGQESTILIMGITWGILGLQEVNEELEKILMKKSRKEKWENYLN